MEAPLVVRLLAFARELQHASTFHELLEVVRVETAAAIGYEHVWLFVGDEENPQEVRLIDAAGANRGEVWTVAPVLKIEGDAMLEEIVHSDRPVVVEDARTDPRTDKAIVEQLGNRTIVNIPLRLLDKPFGAFGMGTFGDEGVRPPTREQLDHLIAMAAQLSVAAGRIRFLEERARGERERQELERRVLRMQKLESLGLLAGGVAHDFNNLLTVILTGTSLARSAIAGKPGEAALDAAIEAANRARDLTRQLLAMSRSQPLSLKAVDVNERLRAFVAMLRRVMTETIQLDLIQAPRLPATFADPSQLDQVFLNLCINARDAMPDGGRLKIETEQVLVNGAYVKAHPWARPGRYVLVTVTDTGSGMPPEVLERVFEPFFTTKKDHGGTGLGLAVTHGIVSQHGGMLHCYSEIGVGTTFKVYLPVHARGAADAATRPEGTPPGGDERLLVAEDDAAVRAAIARILEGAGYQLTLVENGAAACERASRERFDLVILDLVMPQMNGREALERIRTLLPEARFLLSSGYSADIPTASLVQAGAAALLPKPYDPDALLRTVREVLDTGKVARKPAG